jgi:tetraacyldisaccharide 4'-kinase
VQEPFVCPPGDTSAAGGPLWKYCGDEAALIAQRVPGCAIVKGADRVAGARAAIAQLGCDTLLMDDGFQHVRLHRDENILLIDATCPFGNRRVFPAGYLREPLSAARRATEIVLTRCDQAGDLHGLEAELGALAPGVPIRKTWHAPEALVRLADGAVLPLEALRGMEIRALCGIGNPGAFHAALEKLGAVRRETVVLRDHGVDDSPVADPALPTIMTEKDAIKLSRLPGEAYALRIALREWGEG